ncbi:MAG: hypothetical protein WBN36_02370 [Gammaproteobacteria bacterium]
MKESISACITTTILLLSVAGYSESRAANIDYVRWHDPNENAFSTEVPKGWTTEGGLFRIAAADVRIEVTTSSPDGSIRINSGDKHIPTYIVPNPLLEMSGFREGSWYSPGYNVRNLVMRYLLARDFLREYLGTKLAGTCSDLVFTKEQERSDVSSQINAVHTSYGLPVNLNTAEVEFTCTNGGQLLKGHYFAGTQKASMYGLENWTVPYLVGYVAVADKAPIAADIAAHMISSTIVSRTWLSMTQANIDQQVNIVNKTNSAISRTILQTGATQQESLDRMSRQRSDATRGVEYMVDPVTGKRHQVTSGSNYYWIDNRGHRVDTMTDTPPGIHYRKLQRPDE